MDYLILILLGLIFLNPIVAVVVGFIVGLFRGNTNHVSNYQSDLDDNSWMGFDDDSNDDGNRDSRSYSDPFDNHWESSFDWQDEDNDGYDDRDDGFWSEREF